MTLTTDISIYRDHYCYFFEYRAVIKPLRFKDLKKDDIKYRITMIATHPIRVII